MNLIDKDTLVAKIKRRLEKLIHCMSKFYFASNYNEWKSAVKEYKSLISFIDTLEVKEVDLEKEYKDFVEEDPVYNKLVNSIVGKAIAKHFFELGLAQKGE